ncbi:MAG: helix-turn-helix transcriptional regulator [Cellulosilyticum sp.]|nr:helix-turn-helix transcriptional regulator [Cellulosilyticum sp.]
MVDYTGLRILLAKNGLKFKFLKDELHIHPTVIAKINKNEYVSLEILERICLHFDCQLTDICTIKKDRT